MSTLRDTSSKARVWPSILALLGAIPAAVAVQVFLAILILATGAIGSLEAAEVGITEFFQSPLGFILLLLSSQATFLGIAVAGALLSPISVRERLGLRSPELQPIDWLMLPCATTFCAILGGIMLSVLFDTPSEALIQLGKIFTGPSPVVAVGLACAASLLPGFCEELLARGFVQQRLLKRWHPMLALSFASLSFALWHMDLQHVLAVIPLAFWLGYVAWRTNSTWASIFCHAFNNAFMLCMAIFLSGPEDEGSLDPTRLDWILLGLTAPVFVAMVRRLWMKGATRPAHAASSGSSERIQSS